MKKTNYLTVLIALLLTACANDYDFANVDIGDNESEVLAIMGRPTSSENVQLPLGFQTERLTWENRFKGRVYKADFALGKVIDKRIETK
jgi:hypothetical protein